jgi:hypothetical protein
LDDQFQPYVNRVVGLTQRSHYDQQLSVIHSSPKYQLVGEQWAAVPFPGCTVIAPPSGEDPVNSEFYEQLLSVQAKLVGELPQGLFIPLPAQSLHLTLADLLWAQSYSHASQEPGFEALLTEEVGQVFQGLPQDPHGPIRFQSVGYMVMARALGICLVPETEVAYERVRLLRRSLYQQPGLLALGIEQNYHFTAHITLGYFGHIPGDLDQGGLAHRLVEFNQSEIVALPEFIVQRAELRRFDDMTAYHRSPGWPVREF